MSGLVSSYQIILRDQSYNKVAIFDDWINLSYSIKINDVSYCNFELTYPNDKISLFELDGLFEIRRAIPALGVSWYQEFIGLFRGDGINVSEDGKMTYKAIILGLNDLLARTIINYPEGTIKSYKETKAETAIKEYVEENCGATALTDVPYERESNGVLPDFEVEADTASGEDWEGDRAFANLLDTIKDIARLSEMDFNVEWTEDTEKFIFKTFPGQLGEDRTTVGLDPNTGLNGEGNSPVIFSLESGTISSLEYTHDRSDESNVVSVLGDGDGATREIQVRSTSAKTDSPWNRRETSRPQGGFISEMQYAGDEVLNELKASKIIKFIPLQQSSQIYGKHFFTGDRITVSFNNELFHRRITGITNNVTGQGKLTVELEEV